MLSYPLLAVNELLSQCANEPIPLHRPHHAQRRTQPAAHVGQRRRTGQANQWRDHRAGLRLHRPHRRSGEILGAKVFLEEWKGYAPQKNSAIDKASRDWILSLD